MNELSKQTYRLRLWGLIALLIIGGIAHLVMPSFFFPLFPETFPYKAFCILATAPLEFILAYGLYRPGTRKLYARLTALWFILLTPFHINMAMNHTSFHGIPSTFLPEFLWGRVALQLVFVWWAYSLKPRKKLKKKTLGKNLKSV